MIEIKDVCAGYREKEILHHVHLKLEEGKVTVILGPNGCGKSTLLKALIRLNPHTSGMILIDGKPIEQFSSSALAQKISYIPQSRKVPDISVRRMVLHGRFAYLNYPRRYRKEDEVMTEKAMQWVGIQELADKNVNELSGGMQQKVYIAMALAQDTPVILMDEPTVYLDISYQMKMMKMARTLAAHGKAVVMVLHDLVQAFQTADDIIIMDDGKIVAQGTCEEIYESNVIENVFRVKLQRVYTSVGWRYFCE